MENIKDLRVVELICSHLCHEMVSPVGAISNGLEMIEEFGGEPDPEILGLISASAAVTAQRLQYYRVAYGASSGPSLSSDDEFKALADGLMNSGKSGIEWPDGVLLSSMNEDQSKLLLNIIGLAANTLPRGGTISMRTLRSGGEPIVSATAPGCRTRCLRR
jgi:histidine phosphotransferase ChpT